MKLRIREIGLRLVLPGIAVVSCGVTIFTNVSCAATNSMNSRVQAGTASEHKLISVLAPAFMKAGKGGRVYFATTCPRQKDDSIHLSSSVTLPFPSIDTTTSAIGSLRLSTVRDIFRNVRDVTVYENSNELISLNIGNVDKRILQVKISNLNLSPTAQYTPELAINDILNSKSVDRGAHKLGVRLVTRTFVIRVIEPTNGLRHLPPVIKNVTLDQALDMVAATFNGIVIYGSCANRHLYGAKFVGGTYFDRDAQAER